MGLQRLQKQWVKHKIAGQTGICVDANEYHNTELFAVFKNRDG